MKKKILLFALTASLLGGCDFDFNALKFWETKDKPNSADIQEITNKNEQEPENFSDIFKFDHKYKAAATVLDEYLDTEEGQPKQFSTIYMEYKQNGENLGYTKEIYAQFIEMTPAELIKIFTEMEGEEIKESDLPSILDEYAEENGFKYKFENGVYIVESSEYEEEVYYQTIEDEMFPISWRKCDDSENPNFGKYVGRISCWDYYMDPFSGFEKKAEYFTYNKEKSRYEVDPSKGAEMDIYTEGFVSLDHFYIGIKNGLASSLDCVACYRSHDELIRETVTINFEKDSSLTMPSQSELAPLCKHEHISEGYVGTSWSSASPDIVYHYKECYDCGSDLCIGICEFNEEGFCKICGAMNTSDVYYRDAFGNKLLVIVVNDVTKEITNIHFPYDASFYDEVEYLHPNKVMYNGQKVIGDDNNSYSYSAELFTVNGVDYVFVRYFNYSTGEESYYLFEDISITTTNEGERSEIQVLNISGGKLTKFSDGDIYNK